ncbi:MAG: MtrB/PioB family outer membrane beta-barrel protein [Acidobacteriota bacterium]
MRIRLMLSTAVLLLAFTGVARAQQTPAATAAAPALSGTFDLGFRGSSVTGDKARWERYRDLRDGVTTWGDFGQDRENYKLRIRVSNAGYHDQKYVMDYNRYGKLKFTASWDSIPLNYSYDSKTPWKDAGNNVWTLDAATRLNVQNKTLPAGYVGIGSTAANFTQPSIYNTIATPFKMQARRDVLAFGLKYKMTNALGLNLAFTSTKKSGNQPYGASFAFNNGNEIPMTLDNRTNDLTAALEWTHATDGMFRVAYDGSWFNNAFTSLTWDNPLRATDYTTGKPVVSLTNGPWDNSAYSNGNGAAVGRLSLPPSNTLSTFSLLGLYKLPAHSSLNGQLAITSMKQNDAILPYTTNSVLNTAAVWAIAPGLKQLPRATAEAEVKAVNGVLNYSTRPNQYFGFDMRYRFNDHQDRTPTWDYSYNVRFDGVPENVPGEQTEELNVRTNTVEAAATFSVIPNVTLKAAYIFDDVKRTGRAFSNMSDYTYRLSVDTYGNQYVMLRGVFESTKRIGDGFSEASIEEGGAQPGLRFYDEADMDRTKSTGILTITPNQKLQFNLSFAAGDDKYKGEGHDFGLLSNKNTTYAGGVDIYPMDGVTLGGLYSHEEFKANQKSRNANPLSVPPLAYESWYDPNRDWSLDNNETVKNFNLYLDLSKALKNTDIRFSYDYSDSDNAFIHSGPRIQELSTNTFLTAGDAKPCTAGLTSCFQALPNVTNTWQALKLDVKYMFTKKIGAGFGYWYEKLDMSDFATLDNADGSVRIDPLGAIQTGYGNRPYKAQTGFARLIFIF